MSEYPVLPLKLQADDSQRILSTETNTESVHVRCPTHKYREADMDASRRGMRAHGGCSSTEDASS